MANNRMYLKFTPTGEQFYLGKRMASGWYSAPTKSLDDFYDKCERYVMDGNYGELDSFVLEFEDPPETTGEEK